MKTDWKLTAAIIAVLAVPFGIAVYQDARGGDIDEAAVAEAPPIEYTDPTPPAPTAMPPQFFADGLGASAGTPSFGGDLTGVSLGMALDAIPERVEDWARGDQRSWPDSRAQLLSPSGVKLEALGIDFVDDGITAERELTRHWGQPIPSPSGTAVYWYDRDTSLRVGLAQSDPGRAALIYGRYLPLEELLARDGDRFTYERVALIGNAPDGVAKAYAGDVRYQGPDNILVSLPPTELAFDGTLLRMLIEGDAITSYELVIEDSRADLALQLLEQGFGPATAGDSGEFVFESGARLVSNGPASLVLTVGR